MKINEILIDKRECIDAYNPQGTKVFLNGNEIHGVVGVSTSTMVGCIPTVTLELHAKIRILEPCNEKNICDECGCYEPSGEKHCNRQIGTKCMRTKNANEV